MEAVDSFLIGLFNGAFILWSYGSFFLAIIGLISIVGIVVGAFAGITQAAWRFGLSLLKKRIMIVASKDDYETIRCDLIDSGLLKSKNISQLTDGHLLKIKMARLVILVHGYLDSDQLKFAVSEKDLKCGLIMYCPSGKGRLTDEEMTLLNSTPFAALCNFRGRLVNDVLLMMLSTSFKRKDIGQQPK